MPIIPFPTDSKFLTEIREGVLQYARKHYDASVLPLEDLIQEALLTTFDNVQEGKLTELTSSLTTYVISILKNKANEALRKKEKFADRPPQQGQNADDALDPIDFATAKEALDQWMGLDDEDKRKQLQDAVHDIVVNMKEPCKTILWAFYWEGMNMKGIADRMDYNNADVVKSQSSRCKTKVKTAMEEIFKQLRS